MSQQARILQKGRYEAVLEEIKKRLLITVDWTILRNLLVLQGVAEPYNYEPRTVVPPKDYRVIRVNVPPEYVCFACKTIFEVSADDIFNVTFVADDVAVWYGERTTNVAGKIGIDWCKRLVASRYRSIKAENVSDVEGVIWLHHTGTLVKEDFWTSYLKPFLVRCFKEALGYYV